MNTTLKSLTFFLGILCFYSNAISASNPHKFIDTQAQKMVSIIINNQELFAKDPELFAKAYQSKSGCGLTTVIMFAAILIVTGWGSYSLTM